MAPSLCLAHAAHLAPASAPLCGAGTLEWQRQKEPPGGPPALANHTFTAVGQHGAYCFGGQGKRTFNSVHKLDPVTLAWEEVKTLGVGLCISKPTSVLLASIGQGTEQTVAAGADTCPVN